MNSYRNFSKKDNQENLITHSNPTTNKSLKIFLKNKTNNSVFINISNKDLFFTEKLIADNKDISKLKYKIFYEPVDSIEQVIKSRYIPSITKEIKIKTIYLNFTYEDIDIKLNDLDTSTLYRLNAEIVEIISYQTFNLYLPDLVLTKSDQIFISPKYGLIDEENLKILNKKYYGKKVFSNSERDAIKAVKNELEYRELASELNEKEIKSFTMACRSHQRIEEFVDSKYKFSKDMTGIRGKKILFATNSRLFFEEKMMGNDIHPKENLFMKNEWHMGPIYAYDHNYKKYK